MLYIIHVLQYIVLILFCFRQIVAELMKFRCRCHGVSGSCAVQTCWKSLSDFRTIGDTLKQKYESPIRIARRSLRTLKRAEKTKRSVPISYTELVYVHRSPNYCRANRKRGILGTKGRECNKTSSGSDSCDLLCCGRGYNTQVVRLVERCECKFIWCCYVKCKTCETLLDKHTCKWTQDDFLSLIFCDQSNIPQENDFFSFSGLLSNLLTTV